MNTLSVLILSLLPALSTVESNNNINAIGDNGRSVGCLQISAACVEDVNRIYHTAYTLEDRRNAVQSRRIAQAYLTHYGNAYERRTGKKPTAEVLARIWNGGPKGYEKSATLPYWRKVRTALVNRGSCP